MTETTQRRWAAIASVDVVGYSRLMGVDEAGTLAVLRNHRIDLIDGQIDAHHGRIVKSMGDGLLLEFANAIDAVRCALAIQQGMAGRNSNIPDDNKIVFRIGINYAEVIVEADDIFGDGVNLAARLEGLAEPGGVLLSQSLHELIGNELDVTFEDSGNRVFKNIARPVRVWSWPGQLPEERSNRKPFILLSQFEGQDADENSLAQDLHGDLSAALSRLTGLEVILDQRKADYVIRGAVRLRSGRCRISAQLITLADDKQIWADRYSMETEDTFDILDQCVPGIVINIRRQVTADDAARLSDKSTDDMTVEQLLVAAGVNFFTPTKDSWIEGGKGAEAALVKDPNNFMALAMAAAGGGLAEVFCGFRPTDKAGTALAMSRIESSLRQNSKSDMALSVYSGLLLYGENRHTEAIAAAETSLEINPDFNMGLWGLAAAKIFNGNSQAGIEHGLRAVNIDKRDPYVHLYARIVAYGYFAADNYREAVTWFQKADQLAPGLPHNLLGLSASQVLAGDEIAARNYIQRLCHVEPTYCLSEMMSLPFRETDIWDKFRHALGTAGAPE